MWQRWIGPFALVIFTTAVLTLAALVDGGK